MNSFTLLLFWSVSVFWNVFFEGAIILIFDLWLLISVAAALSLYGCSWLFLLFLSVFDFTVIKLLLLIY